MIYTHKIETYRRDFMSINYAIIGGDLRIIELAKMLKKDGHQLILITARGRNQ